MMSNTSLSLSELNNSIGDALNASFPSPVWIKAEISEITINRSGHCYLGLVEMDENKKRVLASARGTIWANTFRMLKPYFEKTTGQSLSQGLTILFSASVNFHPVYGLSLNIRDIDPSYTLGDMAVKRQKILLRLKKDGVLEMNKELELPLVMQKIAVISSPTAAGLQDFIKQLENNTSNIHFYTKLFPALMQGNQTSPSIINALNHIFRYEDFFDVVVIIRGGGAQLDLTSFDDYELASNVAQFPVPVITGIGHDKDNTVIDLIANTQLKTPTAVAEFLISRAVSLDLYLSEAQSRFCEISKGFIDREHQRLTDMVRRIKEDFLLKQNKEEHRFNINILKLKNSVSNFLDHQLNKFQEDQNRLNLYGVKKLKERILLLKNIENKIKPAISYGFKKERNRHLQYIGKLKENLPGMLKSEKNRLNFYLQKNELIDPVNILKKGYCINYKDGEIVKSIKHLKKGDSVMTRFFDGEVSGKIINIKSYEKRENDI